MHIAGYYRRMPLIDVSLRGVYLTGVHLVDVSPILPTPRFKRLLREDTLSEDLVPKLSGGLTSKL
jgi:pyruvoyl-dependent arginine decarboxylase (PvlArgDC)